MDFRNVKSLKIGGKPVSRLLLDGRQVWAKSEPPASTAYIETDGQSYMDLGFVPTSEFRFEACLRTVDGVDYSEDDRFFGCSVSATVRLMRNALSYGTAPYGWFFRNGGFIADGFGDRDNEYHTFRTYDDGSYVVFAYDGSEIVRNLTYATGNTATMKVGLDIPSLGSHPVRIQSFKAWESGELIRDLVPYSGTRGVGMLDRVNDVLYTNAGGGTLTYGEE